IENRLRELSADNFGNIVEDLLNQQAENNELDADNMNDETKETVEKAKADPTPKNIFQAEEAICQNGADNKLTDLLTNIENKLKEDGDDLDPEAKSEIIAELLNYLSTENKYQKQAYKNQKFHLDSLLNRLQNENDTNETQTPW